jgi:uncharacterized cofD-like protein
VSGHRVVAFGGGHGLAASLRALRQLSEDDLTAIVTVADDGGSSGRLREELGVLPPGDLRMALSALCDDGEWGTTWRDVLQHRFASSGPLHDHAVGNLLIVALWQQLGDAVAGLDLVGRLLGARGRVLPMSSVPLAIEADVQLPRRSAPEVVRGQAAVATTTGRVLGVRLDPAAPPARPEAVAAVERADWLVLGPGSWYTSVIPHLLVPELRRAMCETPARRALVLNLDAPRGEARGLTPADHVRVLHEHAPELRVDVALADPVTLRGPGDRERLEAALAEVGAELVLRPMTADGSAAHDPELFASAFRETFAAFDASRPGGGPAVR